MKRISILFLWMLMWLPVMSQQVEKKQLLEEEYDQWGTLNLKNISANGQWISYEMHYASAMDTLFLQNTLSTKLYVYPGGKGGAFGGDRLFGFLNGNDLEVVNLKRYDLKAIKDVLRFDFTEKGSYLVTHHMDQRLQIRNSRGELLLDIESVETYNMNPTDDALIYSQKVDDGDVVGCIRFDNYKHTTVTKGAIGFDGFTWEDKGRLVVFSNGSGLHYYSLNENSLFSLDLQSLAEYQDVSIVKNGWTGFRISSDGKRVFFSIAKTPNPLAKKMEEIVEVWNGTDSILYPTQKELASRETPKLVAWWPRAGVGKVISTESLYQVRLTGKANYVLLSNPFSYGLEPSYFGEVDYFIKNIESAEEKLLLKHYSYDPNMVCVAPNSDFLVYYKEGSWWLYDPKNHSTVNLTGDTLTKWDNISNDDAKQFRVYGVAAWSHDGKYIILYDEYDLWEFSLNGKEKKRLTNGREEGKTYRINRMEYEKIPSKKYDSGLIRSVDLNQAIVLDCSDYKGYSGYALYSKSKGVQLLVFENKYVTDLKRSKLDTYAFTTQTFEQPPQIECVSGERTSAVLFKSNKQHNNYNYGRSELIHYTNSKGKKLQGVLYYPANYQKEQRYPMIVHVYEKMSYQLHHYVNPSLLNSQGFSVTNYTLNGYFVLMPDIAYSLGNPGLSAADCIGSAVKEVVATYPIEANKVGLIGHSFGGYETNFTVTQTDLFAAAVSGAGLSDSVGRYFEIGNNGGAKSEMWRFERQQYRMGGSFFEMQQAYLDNSPILNADTIRTPLLLWSGMEDPVVPFHQSVSYYMALRRLKLRVSLLAYPNEKHTLRTKDAQIDLTTKIRQWFDYYLKDQKEGGWIQERL